MCWSLAHKRNDADPLHPLIVESTTGVVACGYSWCNGGCGYPALVLGYHGEEKKAYGQMVALGPVFQSWRGTWVGKKVPVTLGEGDTVDDLIKRYWR